jgi:hypothetical protein
MIGGASVGIGYYQDHAIRRWRLFACGGRWGKRPRRDALDPDDFDFRVLKDSGCGFFQAGDISLVGGADIVNANCKHVCIDAWSKCGQGKQEINQG